MAAKTRRIAKNGDYWIIFFTMILSLFGIVMVFSAGYYFAMSRTGSPYSYIKTDVMYKALGWILFAVCASLDYHVWRRFARLMLIVGFILLFMIFSPFGITINNATRWLDFKFFTVMPGEVIKTCLIVFIARYFSEDPTRINRPVKGVGPILIIAAAAAGLILLQPNLSTAGTVVLIVAAMLFAAGLPWIWIAGLVGAGVGAFLLIIMSDRGAYMLTRVQTFFDPFKDALGTGYQVVQALLALGSGGLTGVGLGHSIQKTLYLPESESDFILAIIGEELGYVGIIVLMILFLCLIWRCFRASMRAKDRFGMLLAAGISMHLAIQVILNIAVVSASFFPTGVVLPFISMGGNATLLFLSEMGMIYNVSKYSLETEEEMGQEQVPAEEAA